MPKLSKTTASTHLAFPGFMESHEEEVGGWNLSIQRSFTDMDQARFFKGAPNDLCQANHMGYVLEGKFGVRNGDGTEEIFEAGDAFIIKPGHTPMVFDGCEMVAFTPAEEARQQAAVMMPNVLEFAAEQGIELPAEVTAFLSK